MKHRIILILIAVLLGVIALYFESLLRSETIGVCQGNTLCESSWFRGVIWPFLDSFWYVIISILFFVLFPFSFLKIWMKIMIPYFVVAFLLVASTPPLCSGFLCWDRNLIASGLAKLFLILTILIILSKSIYLWVISRRNKKTI